MQVKDSCYHLPNISFTSVMQGSCNISSSEFMYIIQYWSNESVADAGILYKY